MKYIVPHFYEHFHCLAQQCQHTCCAGWEIDIDEKTLVLYQNTAGAFGKRLADSVAFTENGAFFRLDAQERCPFLNRENLCDIILTLGENAICQICRDHPRFRNFFSDRTEIGLGLCCEAAGKLLLGSAEKIRFIPTEHAEAESNHRTTEKERRFFAFREQIFTVLQDRTQNIEDRLQAVLSLCNISLPQKSPSQWAEIFLQAERLDEAWTEVLCTLRNAPQAAFSVCLPEKAEIMIEHLAVYFVYRHLAGALEDGLLSARTAFSVVSAKMMLFLYQLYFFEHGDLPLSAAAEFARLYSAEIEYSQENTDMLLLLL